MTEGAGPSETGQGEVGELPGERRGLRREVHEREVARQGQSLDVHDPQRPLRSSSTTEITDTRAIASLLRTKDLIPSVVPSRIATSSCESRSPTPASAAAITSSVPEPSSRSTSGIRHSASGVTDSVRAYLPPGRATSTRLVGPEERVVQPLPTADALDHAQVDLAVGQRPFDLAAVARQDRNPHAGKTRREARQRRRQQVLCDGRAGSEAQLALGLIRAEAHFVLQPAVVVGDASGGLEQYLPGSGQLQAAAAADEGGTL